MGKKKKKKNKGGAKVSPAAANYELEAQNKKKGELDPRKIEGYTCAKTVSRTALKRRPWNKSRIIPIKAGNVRRQYSIAAR